jgi:hypothetical protein
MATTLIYFLDQCSSLYLILLPHNNNKGILNSKVSYIQPRYLNVTT